MYLKIFAFVFVTFATNFPLRYLAVTLQNLLLPIANIRATIPDDQSALTSLFGNFSLSMHFLLPLES